MRAICDRTTTPEPSLGNALCHRCLESPSSSNFWISLWQTPWAGTGKAGGGWGISLLLSLHSRDYHGPGLGCSFLQTQVTPGRALHRPTCLIIAGDGRVIGPGPGNWHSLVMLILTGKWVPCLEKKGEGTEENCIPSELEDWCSSAKPNISTFKNPQKPPHLHGLSRFSYC